MAEDSSQRVRIWQFRRAPEEYKLLFPEGKDHDWLVHAADSEFRLIGPSLLAWGRVHPVKSITLADGSTILWGAPREAAASLAKLGQIIEKPPSGAERRAAARVRIECPIKYQTLSEPKRAGEGHSIDISTSGICFTSESLLPAGAKITVCMRWPVGLEDGVPVELHAVGTLVRAEPMRAAMEIDETKFLMTT